MLFDGLTRQSTARGSCRRLTVLGTVWTESGPAVHSFPWGSRFPSVLHQPVGLLKDLSVAASALVLRCTCRLPLSRREYTGCGPDRIHDHEATRLGPRIRLSTGHRVAWRRRGTHQLTAVITSLSNSMPRCSSPSVPEFDADVEITDVSLLCDQYSER